ncbi:MAG: hypothetical protein R3F60_32230 [bacterium]
MDLLVVEVEAGLDLGPVEDVAVALAQGLDVGDGPGADLLIVADGGGHGVSETRWG